MSGQTRLCANCDAPQRRPDARFCHECGHPIGPPATPLSPPPEPARRRWLVWLLPLLALILLAAVPFIWAPARTEILSLLRPSQPSWTPRAPSPAGEAGDLLTDDDQENPAAMAGATPVIHATATPQPTATVLPTPMSPPSGTPPPTTPPDVTARPPSTKTPSPTATPSPSPTVEALALVRQSASLRTGPSQEFDRIEVLAGGQQLRLTGRTESGDWLQVQVPDGASGWVSAFLLDTGSLSLETLPVVAALTLPPCTVAVNDQLAVAYQRGLLGCPTGQAHITWSAWEPFERGSMLWRGDTNRVTVYHSDGWVTLHDLWDGVSLPPSRGSPPFGLQVPVRGFGWLWGRRDDVFNWMGWATDIEKGFCALVQDFERGFIYTKPVFRTLKTE